LKSIRAQGRPGPLARCLLLRVDMVGWHAGLIAVVHLECTPLRHAA